MSSAVIDTIPHIEQLPPVRQIRSALVQKGFGNKLRTLIGNGYQASNTPSNPKITRIITSVLNHQELRTIIDGSDITLIHEQSIPDIKSIEQLQAEGYQVIVRASSWRDSRTFHIQK